MKFQDPKYDFQGGRVINRQSGEAIPLDEPVMVFRARDMHSIAVVGAYMEAVMRGPTQHYRAVEARYAEFIEFARHHPERMKTPDTEFEGD